MFRFPYISRKWKLPKLLYALFIIELAGTVAALALFGIADPNLFRTDLWQIGSDYGFNSSPLEILYAYANYRPIPKIPFVWSQALTTFNVVVSVLCTFVLLCKATMFVLHVWYPILSTIVNTILVAMWIVSVVGQAGPDHSDPEHPSNIPWYLSKSCDLASPYGKKHYCLMAKGTFAVTVFLLFIFFLNLLLGIWSMIPSPAERSTQKLGSDELEEGRRSSRAARRQSKAPEMFGAAGAAGAGNTTATPFTPRTLAFNTLDRKLPLRADGSNRYA